MDFMATTSFCVPLFGIEVDRKQGERVVNDLQQRSLARIEPRTLPLCGMCGNHSANKALPPTAAIILIFH